MVLVFNETRHRFNAPWGWKVTSKSSLAEIKVQPSPILYRINVRVQFQNDDNFSRQIEKMFTRKRAYPFMI